MIARTLDNYGISGTDLFKEANIDLSSPNDPENRVPSINMQKAWHLSVQATNDPCFGLAVAKNIQPAALHGLGFSWIASDTLKDALNRLVRYYRILVNAGEIVLEEKDKTLFLWLKIPEHGGRIAYASLDMGLGMFVQLCRLTAGPSFSPIRVEFQRQDPENEKEGSSKEFTDYFDCEIAYGQQENKIGFSVEDLEKHLPTANSALARANDQIVIDYLARFEKHNITNQIRSTVIEQLPSGVPSQENIASQLHQSVRSLQRRLKEEGTTFKQLVDQVRQELAKQYLKEHQRSIGEITYMLGFTEPSNFTRAFKRWVGVSPQQFREST